MSNGLASRLMAFAKQPFNTQGDVVNWTLFFVFALTVAAGWSIILRHIVHNVSQEV